MRKNLAKHTAKKLPLAKRVLALCFALIFVCSCLLPAFANGTGEGLDTPGTEVVEAADPGTEPESMDLYDEPAAMDDDFAVADEPAAMDDDFAVADEPAALDDDFAVADEPAAMDDDFAVADEPAAMDDQVEKPVVDDEPAAMDNEVEKPVEGGEPPVADDTPAKEGATKTTTDASGNTVYEYDTSGTTFPEDDAAALPDGDQMQVDAAFSIPTNIYHFWLKKMSSYDLADIARDAKAAEMTVEQYLAMHGTEKGCYHIMTAADGANLKDYQFADPTSNDDPEGNSRTFAGWYYTDDLDQEQEFVFDEHLYVSEGTTVEVYAKWKVPEATKSVTVDGRNVSFKVDGATTLNIESLDTDTREALEKKLSDKVDPKVYNTLYTFDIKPEDESGLEIKTTSRVTISGLNLDTAADVKVFHQGEELEELEVKVSSTGDLIFKTDGFSPFAILIADQAKVVSDDGAEDRMALVDAYGASSGNSVNLTVGATYTLSGSAYYWHTTYHSWSIESGSDVVELSSGTQGQNMKIKGLAEGTARIKHTYKYYDWKEEYSKDEYFDVTVSKFEDNHIGTAYIYYLKSPAGDPMNNDTGAWAPTTDRSTLKAQINTSGATWSNGYNKDANGNITSTFTNKNIVTSTSQILSEYITSWPDGSTGSTWTVKKGDAKTGSYFTYVWDSIKDAYIESVKEATKVDDLTVDDITEITLQPRKISRDNSSDNNQTYHIDCAISVVSDKVFTAKFMVKDPQADEKWTLVDSQYYKEGQAIIKTANAKISDTQTIDGVKYTLKGWYTEDPDGNVEKYGSLIDENEWTWVGSNGTGFETTSTDKVREDGTVYFYAVWEPETQRSIKITKQVTGWFGDQTKAFTFTVADKNGEQVDAFSLTSGDSREIADFKVQAGDTVTITEDGAEDYETKAQIYYKNSTTNGILSTEKQEFTTSGTSKSITIAITAEMLDLDEIEIVVTNHREGEIDNGVLLDTLPYILILVVVAGGGVLLFLRKRKNDDDE